MHSLLRDLQSGPQNRLGITPNVNVSAWSKRERDGPRYEAVALKVLCKTWSLPAFPLTGCIELLNMVQTFCHEAIKRLLAYKFQWLLSVMYYPFRFRGLTVNITDTGHAVVKKIWKLSDDSYCDWKCCCRLSGINMVAFQPQVMTEFTHCKQVNLISFM